MSPKSSQKSLRLLAKKGTFRLDDARRAGISHTTVLRLVTQGIITRLERGLYAISGNEPIGEEGDYSIVKKRFGAKAVIGGLTALSHYKLIDEVPSKIWVLVPPEVRTRERKYRLLRTKRSLTIGTAKVQDYQIVTLERALVDGLLFSSKIGERVVKTAILRALRSKLTNQNKIFEMARRLGALSVIDREWQSILAGLVQ